MVWRRFNDFKRLWVNLRPLADARHIPLPDLPPSGGLFFSSRNDPATLAKRQEGLNQFMGAVSAVKAFVESKPLQLFCQPIPHPFGK